MEHMSISSWILTRHWLQGRITPLPLASFLNNLKRGRYRRETYGTLFSINMVSWKKKSAKSVEIFFKRKWRFSDVMSRDFWSKMGNIPVLLEYTILK